jgi:two-component system chemotaxis response regulator CheB
MKILRVLVVDDSAANRQMIVDLLGAMDGVEVAGTAGDGDEALRLVSSLRPDMITLDLEMPRMDGFTFLRLLMATRPTPVVVISSYAAKENVFRALELGALDFIAKLGNRKAESLDSMNEQLTRMVNTVRQLSPLGIDPTRHRVGRARISVDGIYSYAADRKSKAPVSDAEPTRIVVVAASTGGPTALLELFARLPAEASASIVVAQHMPERFTKTLAERLDRISSFRVHEAAEVEPLLRGGGLVCPGGRNLELDQEGKKTVARVVSPNRADRYTPSADRLFTTAARVAGNRVIAVVLTGMGDDGANGVAEVKKAGGTVIVEAEETAVIYGMPRAAQRTGRVDRSLPLRELADHLVELIS